ncbi:peptidoglycan-binding protein LysM, partial [Chryseobacterium sediminis]
MTKQIVITALTFGAIILGTSNVQAQNTTATTTVNITLNDVISIDAGSTAIGNTVDFNYVTAADYNSDQTI